MSFTIRHADCLEWMAASKPNRFHAIITDPPYGKRSYGKSEIQKIRSGLVGINNDKRRPLPRFAILSDEGGLELHSFLQDWSELAYRILVPGGHMAIASNPLVLHIVTGSIISAGFENRGVIVRTLRNVKDNFRPKSVERRSSGSSGRPRNIWEPWILFRKPFSGKSSDNVRKWGTGELRRYPDGATFDDLIQSEPTPRSERRIADHPSLKPQAFLRQLVWALQPSGKGRILDPFCGAGSTLAAAVHFGVESVGLDIDRKYVRIAKRAVTRLAELQIHIPHFD